MQSVLLTKFKLPIKLVVGLGNIGVKYKQTRHNAGFLFLDYFNHIYLNSHNYQYNLNQTTENYIYEYDDLDLILVKPQMFMNKSGEALLKFIKYKTYSLEEILVVHDDLDIALGKYKLQVGKSPKLHNGVTSIENQLAGKGFYRLRIGVENRNGEKVAGINYVLKSFDENEMDILQSTFDDITNSEFLIS